MTSEKIVNQIELIKGWSTSKVNRPNFYVFKIKRDSGYASIAVSMEKELLFGKYKSSDFENIEELLSQHSDNEIKLQFKQWESKDERSIPELVSIRKKSLGKYNSLEFVTEYNMSGRILSVDYEILLGNNGWILIGCSYSKSENEQYKNEFDLILSNVGIRI
ncbi:MULTISPECIES: hypothetical protein [Winogradskyella]|uniref:hypothetical protein n=1 Tax=Winogradskyella TaxID=286104 RepID=UPI0015CDE5EC|nr:MULTISPECIES: hypothetical protein [Winogradskyella]QXP78810.1 hypothetical protein H0I32_16635 [Winogradskyella sp. HaHa_3_26]